MCISGEDREGEREGKVGEYDAADSGEERERETQEERNGGGRSGGGGEEEEEDDDGVGVDVESVGGCCCAGNAAHAEFGARRDDECVIAE